MNLNSGSKNTIRVFEDQFIGKQIALLFSSRMHTLFYPSTIYQFPFELYVALQSVDSNQNDVHCFAMKGLHSENPNDGWREKWSLEIAPLAVDPRTMYQDYSVLMYKTSQNRYFSINRMEYYLFQTEEEHALFAVRFIENEVEQMLITHQGYGNGVDLIFGKKWIDAYFNENPFGNKLVKYRNV